MINFKKRINLRRQVATERRIKKYMMYLTKVTQYVNDDKKYLVKLRKEYNKMMEDDMEIIEPTR